MTTTALPIDLQRGDILPAIGEVLDVAREGPPVGPAAWWLVSVVPDGTDAVHTVRLPAAQRVPVRLAASA